MNKYFLIDFSFSLVLEYNKNLKSIKKRFEKWINYSKRSELNWIWRSFNDNFYEKGHSVISPFFYSKIFFIQPLFRLLFFFNKLILN